MATITDRIADWDQLYPGRFFKAGDIRAGEKLILVVSAVHVEPLEGDKGPQEKGVLTFESERRQLPLNKTNGICLREMFGRVPYKWVGHRFAVYQDMYGTDPCIRVWGSPELEADLVVEIKLPKKRPFTMTMHAMAGPKPVASRGAKPKAAPQAESRIGTRATEILDMLARAGNLEDVKEIEIMVESEHGSFNADETRILGKAIVKRRGQFPIDEEGPASDNIPF